MKTLLHDYYGPAYNSPLRHEVKYVECTDKQFEIKDKVDQIVCRSGEGIAVFGNPSGKKIVIIDFENYVNQYRGQAGLGERCDFILYDGDDVVVLNELTECKERFLEEHESDGEVVKGKRSKAISQIQASISKLYHSDELKKYIDSKNNKIGLFSYKLKSDVSVANSINVAMAKFRTVNQIFADISSEEVFTDGFVFEQRIYPMSFDFQ